MLKVNTVGVAEKKSVFNTSRSKSGSDLDTSQVSRYNVVDSAKKLCNTRTIMSTSSKCIIQGIQVNSFTFTCTVLTDFLEYFSNRLCRRVGLTPPIHQDLKRLPKHLKWLKQPENKDLVNPGKGVNTTPPIYLRSSCCLLFWHLTV